MSIDEKIGHRKKVFRHAGERGIDVYLFHWTVFVNEAHGKYGITEDQTNPITIHYVRACVKEALLTYPALKGSGVTSGENDRRELDGTPAPADAGFTGPYEMVITRGKQLAIIGSKNGKRAAVWSDDPDFKGWTGQFKQ